MNNLHRRSAMFEAPMKLLNYILMAGMVLTACTPRTAKKTGKMAEAAVTPEAQHKVIENYVKSKGLKGQFTASGLFVSVITPGNGEHPKPTSTVQAEYTGYMLDGSVFDASQPGQPISFSLNGVVAGWTEGLQFLKPGGKAILILPSHLGYGANASGPIPANSILAFEVTLVDFK